MVRATYIRFHMMKFSWSQERARMKMKYTHMRWSTNIQHETKVLQFHVDVAPCGIRISYFSGWILMKKKTLRTRSSRITLENFYCVRVWFVHEKWHRVHPARVWANTGKFICVTYSWHETEREGGTSSRIGTNYLLQFECLFTACLLLYEIKHLLSQQLPFILSCLVVLSQFWADGWMNTHNFGGVRWILTSLHR